MVLDVGGLGLQTLSGRNSDGERLVGQRSTLLHVPPYRKLRLSKASPGRRRVFLVTREMHAISYQRIPGREKGKAVLDVGCRTSEWALSQRNKSWDGVDYPDKRAFTPRVGNRVW